MPSTVGIRIGHFRVRSNNLQRHTSFHRRGTISNLAVLQKLSSISTTVPALRNTTRCRLGRRRGAKEAASTSDRRSMRFFSMAPPSRLTGRSFLKIRGRVATCAPRGGPEHPFLDDDQPTRVAIAVRRPTRSGRFGPSRSGTSSCTVFAASRGGGRAGPAG